MNSTTIKNIENVIQYEFNNKNLLSQAFLFDIDGNNETISNTPLMIIGKRSINFSLVSLLSEYYGSVSKGKPYKYSIGTEQINNILDNLESKDFYRNSISVLGLSQYIEALSEGEIECADRKLFDALIGAITVDSNFDTKVVGKILSFMLDIDYWLDNGFDNLDENPTIKIYNYTISANIDQPSYNYKKQKDEFGNLFFKCGLKLSSIEEEFVGVGSTASEARTNACSACYTYLEDNKLIADIKKDAGDFNVENAMDTLDNLALKGYFMLADYDTEEAKEGYKSTIKIDDIDNQFVGFDADKHLARSKAAYKMLCYLVGYEVPTDEELNK